MTKKIWFHSWSRLIDKETHFQPKNLIFQGPRKTQALFWLQSECNSKKNLEFLSCCFSLRIRSSTKGLFAFKTKWSISIGTICAAQMVGGQFWYSSKWKTSLCEANQRIAKSQFSIKNTKAVYSWRRVLVIVIQRFIPQKGRFLGSI